MVFDRNKERLINPTRDVAYIVEVKEADLRESADEHCYSLVCSSVPRLVQLSPFTYL